MFVIEVLAVILAALTVMIGPFVLVGALIQWRRRRAAIRAVTRPGRHRTDSDPLLPQVREPIMVQRINLAAAEPIVSQYVAEVGTAAETCLRGIEAALVAFETAGRTHYGETYAQLTKLPGVPVRTHGTPGNLLQATRVALVRMRVGFYEPIQAYRPGNTPTSLQGMRGLRDLLAAEAA